MRRLAHPAAGWILALLALVKLMAVVLEPASFSFRLLPLLAWALVPLGLFRLARREGALRWRDRALLGWSLMMLAFGVMVLATDLALRTSTPPRLDLGPTKIWAARGLVVEGPEITDGGSQNSIEAVGLAFECGAQGAEVDVFFDPERDGFVVSHDRPYRLKNGRILPLAELLESLGDRGRFWLDWKKLRHLSDEELDAAIQRLLQLTADPARHARIFVEGEAPFPIRRVRAAGLQTIFDIRPLPDSHLLSPIIGELYKTLFVLGGHTVLAMNSGSAEDPIYGAELRRILRGVPVFLYHTPNDEAFLDELLALPEVRVLLLVDHSVDRYRRPTPPAAEPD